MPRQPAYEVLIGVIAVSLGVVARLASVSPPAGMILVLVAFAAGLNQTNQYWKITLLILLAGSFTAIPFRAQKLYL